MDSAKTYQWILKLLSESFLGNGINVISKYLPTEYTLLRKKKLFYFGKHWQTPV